MQNAEHALSRRSYVWPLLLLAVLALGGLYLVKWDPYFHKAFLTAAHHSLGPSLVSGTSAQAPAPSWQAAWGYALAYFKAVWQAVILGLVLGAGAQALLPADWLRRLLGKESLGSVAWAAAAAVPSMMCTCCTAPVAVGMRQRRVSMSAALAYWIGNPMLNPATLVFMGFVLGWQWTALRMVMALVTVFGVSYLAGRITGETNVLAVPDETRLPATEQGNPFLRFITTLGRLSVMLIPEYAIIVLALGAARAWLFPLMSPAVGHSLLLGLWLAVAGTLFVIPTAGEIPIVQGLLAYGLGPFGAGTLLITLPAVSLPSLVMIGRSFPRRALAMMTLAVVVLGIVSGAVASFLGF
jgi:uncharacterized membrane protein YraQ (UPF0718 family)